MDTQSIEQIEREITRLKAERPEFNGRIEKAENLLVTQLSVSNSTRPIRVRISANGHTYTVRSGSRLSTTYTVEPAGWTCDCPATKTCYHVIGCWVLEQLAVPKPAKTATCCGCNQRHPISELTEIEEGDPRFLGTPLAHFPGDILCRSCFEGVA